MVKNTFTEKMSRMVKLQRQLRGESSSSLWSVTTGVTDICIFQLLSDLGGKKEISQGNSFLGEKGATACIYVTETTSVSHSQPPFVEAAGAEALPVLGACPQAGHHGWHVAMPTVGWTSLQKGGQCRSGECSHAVIWKNQ